MADERKLLAEGTAMATRVGSIESATDFILQHDKTVERFAKIEVLESAKKKARECYFPWYVYDLLDDMIAELKAGQ